MTYSYKIIRSPIDGDENTIYKPRGGDYIGWSISRDESNTMYRQFIQDVAEQGIEIVEGPDIIEPDYATLRSQEYPTIQEQEDMKYWDEINGTTVWRDTITAIKDKYPKTITGGTTVGPIPEWVMEEVNKYKSS